MASGSITHSIAEMLRMGTGEPPISTEEERKGSNALVVRTALGIVPVAAPETPQAIGRALDQVEAKAIGQAVGRAVAKPIDPVAGKPIDLAVGRLIGLAAAKPIGPAAAVELRVQAVAEIKLVTARYPRVQGAEAAVP